MPDHPSPNPDQAPAEFQAQVLGQLRELRQRAIDAGDSYSEVVIEGRIAYVEAMMELQAKMIERDDRLAEMSGSRWFVSAPAEDDA